MAREKTGKFDQIAYQNEFNKRNYDRIEVKVPKGRKAVIKEAAAAAGQSVNEFVNQAIRERIEGKERTKNDSPKDVGHARKEMR